MIRKIIEIDKEKNATAAACAPTPATRALSAWWTAKPLCSATTTATASATACRSADRRHLVRRARSRRLRRSCRAGQYAGKISAAHRMPGQHGTGMERAPVNQPASFIPMPSQLRQWPVQIKLVPVNAPYFQGAKPAYRGRLHRLRIRKLPSGFYPGKVTLVGCPKLDDVDYSEKLTEILRQNNIKSVTVVRMEVPCCGGLEYAVRTALQNCGKLLPWQVKTISIKGELLDD